MKRTELNKFISYLIKNYSVYAPQEESGSPAANLASGGQIFIRELTNPKKAVIDERSPFYSWKKFFVPEKECLFEYSSGRSDLPRKTDLQKLKHPALLGLNILDLKSVLLYDLVFSAKGGSAFGGENDSYYQERRQNILIIGHNFLPGPENNLARVEYSEEALKHLPFDIFLATNNGGPSSVKLPTTDYSFIIFTGSEKGQRVLEDFGYKNYQHIQFIGPEKQSPGSKMDMWRDKLKNHHNPKIWEELGRVCIECGKCTLVCPTCFCFRIDDQPELKENTGVRNRCWDSCFFQEFAEIAGGHKFLNNTADRIHFWYYHKFARIPDEFGITGCIGCHRCFKVCPVGIDIKKVLRQVEET